MKRFELLALSLLLMFSASAQIWPFGKHKHPATLDSSKAKVQAVQAPKVAPVKIKKDWSKVNLSNRPNDHFIVQVGYDGWAQRPDTIKTKGFSRSLNIYFMYDFPFKTNPRFSVGVGLGIGSSNIFFDNQEVDITNTGNNLAFPNKGDTTHFKKYKLVTAYLEAPVELRFAADPENNDHSWKGAIGVKVGTMLSAHTKGKNLVSSNGSEVNNIIMKESSKRFFNSTRFCVTGRVGYGHITLFGQYQVNALIRDGFGPGVHPFSIGLSFGGL
jgi:hypothetical protein